MSALERSIVQCLVLADEFDLHRHCGWNSSNVGSDYIGEPVRASDVPAFASLGRDCYATIQELALLHTLRPCKDCGGEYLYKSGYQIGCCSCFGERDGECEDCKSGSCGNFAVNANLQDAITRWNLHYGDKGTRGRVMVIG